jgi:alkylhydroperoxidase family enzyme
VRIRGLEPNEASWPARLLFWVMRRQVGKVITPMKVLAHRTGILWASTGMTAALEFSKAADKNLKRLVALRTAQIVGCVF